MISIWNCWITSKKSSSYEAGMYSGSHANFCRSVTNLIFAALRQQSYVTCRVNALEWRLTYEEAWRLG